MIYSLHGLAPKETGKCMIQSRNTSDFGIHVSTFCNLVMSSKLASRTYQCVLGFIHVNFLQLTLR